MTIWKATIAFLLVFALGHRALAGNNALSQPQTITTGERVAAYLQSLMIPISAILEAKRPGDLLNPRGIYRVGVTFDPQEKVLDVSVVGNRDDLDSARKELEMTRDLLLSFNKKITRNFGIALGENDLAMDYLDVKMGKIILRYHDGKFETPSEASALKTPEPQSTPTATADND